MNKIYRVVWSHVSQTWVAVSELCRAKSKIKPHKLLSLSTLMVLSLFEASNYAFAAKAIFVDNESGGIAISTDSSADSAISGERWAIAIGNTSKADKDYDIAIGGLASANGKGQGAIAIGKQVTANASGAVAIGRITLAIGELSSAYGAQANASGENSTSLGSISTASGADSTAVGASASALSGSATAVGFSSSATGDSSSAFGVNSRASASRATAVGDQASASSNNSSAFGPSANASGERSFAAGMQAVASGRDSVSLGAWSEASGNNSSALSALAAAKGENSIAAGNFSEASESNAIALGYASYVIGKDAAAIGSNTNAYGKKSFSAGSGAASTADDSTAVGADSKASNANTTAIGKSANSSGSWSTAVGTESKASGTDSAAFGANAEALSTNSVAAGKRAKAKAEDAAAYGRDAEASAEGSLALGAQATAGVKGGVALGEKSSIEDKDGNVRTGLNKDDYSFTRKSDDQTSEDYKKFANKNNTGFGDNEDSDVNKVYAPVKLVENPNALKVIKDTILGSTGPVSVGNSEMTRQLINVAPGSADSDAVNVAQLKAVAGEVRHYNISDESDVTVETTEEDHKTTWTLKLKPTATATYGFKTNATGNVVKDKENDPAPTAQAVAKDATVNFEAGKNLTVKRTISGNNQTYTFATTDTPEFKSISLKDGDSTVNLTTANGQFNLSKPKAEGSNETEDVKITGVTSGLTTYGKDGDDKDTPQTGLINLENKDVPDSNAATVGDLRKMGWVVSTQDHHAQVKNADEVKFVGKGLAKVTGKTEGNVHTVTVDVDAQRTVEGAQLPVVYTDSDGNKLVKVGDEFYLAEALKEDGSLQPNAKPVEVKDVIASMNSGDENTTIPMALANVASHLMQVDDNTGKVTGLDGTELKGDNKTAPMTASEAATLVENAGNHAATVSDVLNVGWGLKANGSAVDFVRPFDTVNWTNGTNTTVVAESDGTTSKLKVNVTGLPMTYTDANGNKVAKADDGKWYPVDENGSPDKSKTEVSPTNIKTNLVNVNPESGKTDTNSPTQLGNVNSGLTTYGKDGDGKDTPQTGLINLENKDGKGVPDSNAATVGDLREMGWVVSTQDHHAQVKNADEVKFVGKGLAKVTSKTEGNVHMVTVDVDAQRTVEGAQLPVVYTDSDGNKLVKVGDVFYLAEDLKEDGSLQPNAKPVEVEEVIASMNSGDENTTIPMALANVASHLMQVDDNTGKVTGLDGTELKGDNKTAPMTASEAATLVENSGNHAATVSDVLNAGWGLKANGSAVDFVRPFDTVNWTNGTNTTVVAESDGTTSTLKVNLNPELKDLTSAEFKTTKGDKPTSTTNVNGNGITINPSIGDKTQTVSLTNNGLDNGGNRITHVAPGRNATDAVNVSQLRGVARNLHNHISNVDKHYRAGVAGALATAQLPQPYLPGKSMVSAAAGNYRGQSGIALGVSRISDNGKVIVRFSGMMDSQGATGVAAGVGYQW